VYSTKHLIHIKKFLHFVNELVPASQSYFPQFSVLIVKVWQVYMARNISHKSTSQEKQPENYLCIIAAVYTVGLLRQLGMEQSQNAVIYAPGL